MQDDCGDIYPAVLVNILRGQEAYNALDDTDTPFETKIYGPTRKMVNRTYTHLYYTTSMY